MKNGLLVDKILEKGMDLSKIAKLLGIDKMTLYRKLASYEPITVREVLEEAATRFFKKVYIQKKKLEKD